MKNLGRLYIALLALAVVLFCVVGYSFFHDWSKLSRNGELHRPHPRYFFRSAEYGSLPYSAADFIRDWMTFGYINASFGLPSDYLQSELGINDPQYPNVSVRTEAGRLKISSSDYLARVQKAVRAAPAQ